MVMSENIWHSTRDKLSFMSKSKLRTLQTDPIKTAIPDDKL